MKHKYSITIEFETDDKLHFPTDGALVSQMEAQLEHLSDDLGINYVVKEAKLTGEVDQFDEGHIPTILYQDWEQDPAPSADDWTRQAQPTQHHCTCDTRTIMAKGCKCGGI